MPQSPVLHRWMRVLGAVALVFALATVGLPEAQAQEKKPNILVIFGDDIGLWNISVWNRGHDGLPNAEHRPHRQRRRAVRRPTTASRAARPAAPPSSPASPRSAPA